MFVRSDCLQCFQAASQLENLQAITRRQSHNCYATHPFHNLLIQWWLLNVAEFNLLSVSYRSDRNILKNELLKTTSKSIRICNKSFCYRPIITEIIIDVLTLQSPRAQNTAKNVGCSNASRFTNYRQTDSYGEGQRVVSYADY